MNLFQRVGMRVATVACLGGFGAPACAPTAAQRQAEIAQRKAVVDAFVRAHAPSWVLNPPPGTGVGRSRCLSGTGGESEARFDFLIQEVARQCGPGREGAVYNFFPNSQDFFFAPCGDGRDMTFVHYLHTTIRCE